MTHASRSTRTGNGCVALVLPACGAAMIVAGLGIVFGMGLPGLVPASLRARPTQYAQTAAPGQTATHRAEFFAPSRVEIDTPVPAVSPQRSPETPSPDNPTRRGSPNAPITTPVSRPPKQTPSTRPESTLKAAAGIARPTLPAARTATPLPPRSVHDVITSTMAEHQAEQDSKTEGMLLRDVAVQISAQGLTLTGVMPGVFLPAKIELTGTVVVRDESLEFKAWLLRVNEREETSPALRARAERAVTGSLHRLLPGRRVQRYELMQDALHVYSFVQEH